MADQALIDAVRADPVGTIMGLRDDGTFTTEQALQALRGLEQKGLVRSRGLGERIVSRIDDAVRMLANDLTFGAADAMAAGADTVFGGTFGENLQRQEAQTDAARSVSTAANVVSGVAGGLMQAGGLATAIPAAASSVNFAARGLPLVTRATRAATAVGAGSAAGGATGFFTTRGDLAQRGVGAAGGALTGGVVALAAPVALSLIQSLGKSVAGRISSALTGPNSQAMRLILQAFERDEITFEQMSARMQTLGSRAFLVDAGNENVAGLLRAAASEPGRGRRITERLLNRRMTGQGGPFTGGVMAGQADVIAQRLEQLVGRNAPASETVAQLRTTRATQAEQLYTAAFNEADSGNLIVDVVPVIADISARLDKLPDGVRSSALRRALGFITRDVDGNRVPLTDLETLHNAKREIDNMIETRKAGDLTLDSSIVRDLTQIKNQLVETMGEASPAYRTALNTFAGDSAYIRAIELGTKLFSKGADAISPEDVRGMTESELVAFRLGAADAIIDRLSSQRDVADATRAIFGSPALRETMTLAFGGDVRAFREFQKVVLQEARFAATRNASLPSVGSRTAVLEAERADLGRDFAAPILQAATGDFAGAAMSLGRNVVAQMQVSDPRMREEIVRTLMSQSPNEIQQTLDNLALNRLLRDLGQGLESAAFTGAVAGQAGGASPAPLTPESLLSQF